MRIVIALYRALFALAPRDLRDRHEADAVALLEEQLAEAHPHGTLAVMRTAIAALADTALRLPYEHWRRLSGSREPRMTQLVTDARFAIRSFVRQPGATLLIVLTLALGVAANTAVFALVDGVFFRSLPYAHAGRLVDLNERAPTWGLDFVGINYGDFLRWRTHNSTFESMAVWDDAAFNVSTDGSAERLEGQQVTWDMAQTLGIKPVLGRSFTKEEDVPNGPAVAMLGYGYWQQQFAGARDVIGKPIRIGSRPYTIVGVLPPNITLDGPTNLWVPLGEAATPTSENYSYEGVGRLKPGVTLEQASADLMHAQDSIWRARDTVRAVSPRVMPLRDRFVSEYKSAGAALGAGVVLVLLIACANVAGAMLARSVFRRREMGIRVALGASGGRLTRQLLTESLVLAIVAGIIGTAIGRAGISLITAGIDQPPPWMRLTLDARAIGFSIAIVVATTLLFGLIPAIHLRRSSSGSSLLAGSTRTTGSRGERRLLDALVAVEVALAAILLVAGGLLVRAYQNLRAVDPGFRAEGVASFRVSLPAAKYHGGLQQKRFFDDVVARVRALPGVTSAGAVTCAPFSCHWGMFLSERGAPPLPANQKDEVMLARLATPQYFDAMGIRFVRGRGFAANEGSATGPRPIVINEEMVHQLWPSGDDPIGKQVVFRGDTSSRDVMTVIGVVHDVRHYGLSTPMRGGMYMSTTALDSANDFGRFTIVAHTAGDPSALFPAIRRLVREMDPELPVFDVKTMDTALAHSMATRRTIAMWLASFAAVALCLALGGIYAMLSYVVGRRRHEIGIRVALGARRSQVVRLVVGQGARPVAIGLAIGVPVALIGTRYLASLLVGVTARDPVTYCAVVLVVSATGIAAALMPARRAARVDPMLVMRAE